MARSLLPEIWCARIEQRSDTIKDLIEQRSDTIKDLTEQRSDTIKDLIEQRSDTIKDLIEQRSDTIKDLGSSFTSEARDKNFQLNTDCRASAAIVVASLPNKTKTKKFQLTTNCWGKCSQHSRSTSELCSARQKLKKSQFNYLEQVQLAWNQWRWWRSCWCSPVLLE